jgi:hypothetical protein
LVISSCDRTANAAASATAHSATPARGADRAQFVALEPEINRLVYDGTPLNPGKLLTISVQERRSRIPIS